MLPFDECNCRIKIIFANSASLYRDVYIQINMLTDRQIDRHTDRQIDRQSFRQKIVIKSFTQEH